MRLREVIWKFREVAIEAQGGQWGALGGQWGDHGGQLGIMEVNRGLMEVCWGSWRSIGGSCLMEVKLGPRVYQAEGMSHGGLGR